MGFPQNSAAFRQTISPFKRGRMTNPKPGFMPTDTPLACKSRDFSLAFVVLAYVISNPPPIKTTTMAKKSKRPNRPASIPPKAQAPLDTLAPNDPRFQALFKIRTKRWLCLAFIFAFLPICTLLGRYSIDLLAFALFGLFVVGHVLYRWLNYSKCPCCGGWFFLKATPDGKTIGSGLSFPPVNRCQNCGQSLFG